MKELGIAHIRNKRQRTQEAGVGDVRENLDPGPVNGNNPCGRGGISGVGNEIGVVGRDDQTEDKDTEDVEQEDTNPDTTNGFRNVLGRIACFGGSHSENLGSQEGVGSADQNRPDASKPAQRTRDILVLDESAGFVLRKTNSVILLAGQREQWETIPSSGIRDGHGWERLPNR